jgi:Mor family transcriptional regulator
MPSDPAQSETYPELLVWLAAKIAASLIERGIDATLAEDAGRYCAECLRRDWGGYKTYLPMGKSYDKELRDREIAARWNGRNTRELCAEFEVSETTIRRAAIKLKRQ